MVAFSAMVPGLSIAAIALIAALPWGVSADDRFALPLLPFVAITYWALRRPRHVPDWLVFLCGLALDVLTQGPLGYWAFVYLAGYAVARLAAPLIGPQAGGRWLLPLTTLFTAAICAWALASLYFLALQDWRPFATGVVLAVLGYPLLAVVLRALDRLSGTRSETFLRGVGPIDV